MLRLRSPLRLALPYLTALLPVLAGCGQVTHVVGSDTGGEAGTNEGGTGDCTTRAGLVCNTPNVPVGCTLGPSTCSNDVIHCGEVVCPATSDAGDCSNASADCVTPELSPGCTRGPNTCVNGSVHCGEVTCTEGGDAGSDATACTGALLPPCPAPPSGCTSEGPRCVNGSWTCGTYVCSDVSTDSGSDGGTACTGALPECPGPPSGCTSEGPLCVNGSWTCGTNVCGDASTTGTTFSCGTTTCNSATEYCAETYDCVAHPDASSAPSYACQPIPSNCTSLSDPCTCSADTAAGGDPAGSGASVVSDSNGECLISLNCG